MISCDDYFDSQLYNTDYESVHEHLHDMTLLADMILEELLHTKRKSQSRSYYALPPTLRERQTYDADFPGEFAKALKHIRSRSNEFFPFDELTKLLDLSDYESTGILLSLAAECDGHFRKVFSELAGEETDYPTLGILNKAMALLGAEDPEGEGRILDPLGPMCCYCFAGIGNETSSILSSGLSRPMVRLRLYPNMVTYLLGDEHLEDFVMRFFNGRIFTPIENAGIGRDFLLEQMPHLLSIGDSDDDASPIIILDGESHLEKEALVEMLGTSQGSVPFKINIPLFLALDTADKLDHIQQLLLLLLGASDVFMLSGILPEQFLFNSILQMISSVRACSDRTKIFIDSILPTTQDAENNKAMTRILRNVPYIGTKIYTPAMPDIDCCIELWSECLEPFDPSDEINIAALAECYCLGYDDIVRISEHAGELSRSLFEGRLSKQTLYETIANENSAAFGALATKIDPAFTWDDLQIEPPQLAILKLACDRYRHRHRINKHWGIGQRGTYGNGVSVLMYGPPGTGKTMAAQIIAGELGIPLYRVDLSQLSSKYIGETEKNLSKVFDEAARSNVILFFDEADSVFSKRTEVENSNDKHANNESAFLLQKLESYSGLVLLATNLYNNFDNAFVRRITYAVGFVSPDEPTRRELFRTVLPSTVEYGERIDYDFFAKSFELSGSNIKAIMLGAAYIAEIEGSKLMNRHIVMSMCYEFKKIGKMISVSDFGPYGIYCVKT